jgi:predicted amidohydrolase
MVKVAGVQMDPKIMQTGLNLENMMDRLQEAAANKARIVVFPECALTGYCFNDLEEARPYAETIPGPSTEAMGSLCAELNVYAIMGMLEADGDKVFNAAAMLGPEGLVGSYRKIHLPFLGVDRFVAPGDRPFATYDTSVGRLGMNICFDASLPESARIMSLDGAELIALPTNWPVGAEVVADHVINTRAIENGVNFMAVNRVGEERGYRFIGGGKVVGPNGITIAQAGREKEEIFYADVDMKAARNKRVVITPGQFEVDRMNSRRPEFYGPLTEPL